MRERLAISKVPPAFAHHYEQMKLKSTYIPAEKADLARQAESLLQFEMNRLMPHGYHYGEDHRLYIHSPPRPIQLELELTPAEGSYEVPETMHDGDGGLVVTKLKRIMKINHWK